MCVGLRLRKSGKSMHFYRPWKKSGSYAKSIFSKDSHRLTVQS